MNTINLIEQCQQTGLKTHKTPKDTTYTHKKTSQAKEYIFPVYKGLSRVEHNGFKKQKLCQVSSLRNFRTLGDFKKVCSGSQGKIMLSYKGLREY